MTVPNSPAAPKRKSLVTRFHLFGFGVLIAITATALVKIPAEHGLPVHWAFDGKPDQYWPRNVAVAVAPALAVLLGLVFGAVGQFAPVSQIEPGRRISEALLTWLLGLLCAIQFAFILVGIGSDIDMVRIIAAAVAVVLIAIGVQLTQSPPNAYTGLRLPWTMQTPTAWVAVHRFSGTLLVVGGLALGAITWLWPGPASLLGGIAAAILVPLLGSIAFSLVRARS